MGTSCMQEEKTNILAQLQKEILTLQGFKPALPGITLDLGLGLINRSFPNGHFPIGAIHEFLCPGAEETAASVGFIAGLLKGLMSTGGTTVWINSGRTLFPPGLVQFGLQPDKFLFVDVEQEKDILWVMEEALKCNSLSAVVGEIRNIPFTASRRLQLAVEHSRVTGFLLHRHTKNLNNTAAVSRWKVTSLPSRFEDDLPGVGFPRWQVDLLKIRNGKPGSWQLEWINGKYQLSSTLTSLSTVLQKKTG